MYDPLIVVAATDAIVQNSANLLNLANSSTDAYKKLTCYAFLSIHQIHLQYPVYLQDLLTIPLKPSNSLKLSSLHPEPEYITRQFNTFPETAPGLQYTFSKLAVPTLYSILY